MDHGSCFHSFRNSISNHPLTCPFDSFLLKALSSLCFLSADVFLGWIWVTMVVDIRENAWPWRIDSHVLFTYVNSGSILFNISANTNPMDPFSSGKFLCFFGSTSLNDDDRLGILPTPKCQKSPGRTSTLCSILAAQHIRNHFPAIPSRPLLHDLNRKDPWILVMIYCYQQFLGELPSRELTYPPKMAFWRWFSFSQGGIC